MATSISSKAKDILKIKFIKRKTIKNHISTKITKPFANLIILFVF